MSSMSNASLAREWRDPVRESSDPQLRQRMSGLGRVFADKDGHCWTVLEIHATSAVVDIGCLTFVSGACVRQVWDYPPDWRWLPPAVLEGVSGR